MDDYAFLKSLDPYFLTPQKVVEAKLELLHLKNGDVLCDLGVGDARSLISACKIADIKAVGYELRPEAFEIAIQNIAAAKLENQIQIFPKNMLEADVSNVTAMHLYLTRTLLGAISEKLENELPVGARIVTHEFDLPAWKPIKTTVVEDNGRLYDVFLYQK